AADAQPAAQLAGELLELVLQAVDLGQHALSAAQDHLPLWGQLDAAARGPEDLEAELELQSPGLLRDRRLGEVELLTPVGQRAVARHGGDRAQMTEFHGCHGSIESARSRSHASGGSHYSPSWMTPLPGGPGSGVIAGVLGQLQATPVHCARFPFPRAVFP